MLNPDLPIHGMIGLDPVLGSFLMIFFWCYLSSQLTELIDISHIEEMQISRATRTLPGITVGCLWALGSPTSLRGVESGPLRSTTR